jgi:hypothetical protein
MSKGWESKNVEEQMAGQQDAAERAAAGDKAQKSADEVERQRKVAALKLQHANILGQRTASPHRRAALQAAVEHVEQQLAGLAGSA